MRAWLLLATLLLSGCSGGDSGGGGGADDATPDAGAENAEAPGVCVDAEVQPTGEEPVDGECAPPAPTLHVVEVSFDGNLGTSAVLCEGTSGQCVPPAEVVEGETDYLYEHPGATLVAVNLTLSWTAASAATDTLGLGAMRMGSNSTLLENVEGTSPLEIQAEALDLLMDEENGFHAYVYNVKGLVHQDPAFGYVSADNAFHVEGTLTFSIPSSGATVTAASA